MSCRQFYAKLRLTIGVILSYDSVMPSKKHKPLPELGKLERAVLERLWRAGEADVIETHRAVGTRRGITVNTVGSALERLHRKGLVTRWKVSHAYRYQPALDRESFVVRQMVDPHQRRGLSPVAMLGCLAALCLLALFAAHGLHYLAQALLRLP